MELQKDTRQMEDEETFLLNKIKEDKQYLNSMELKKQELNKELQEYLETIFSEQTNKE